MLALTQYTEEVKNLNDEDEKKQFIQKYYFHGNPIVFDKRENDYYLFRKRIADNFKITFHDVLIVGSAKFGFSPYKFTDFSLNSDIDVVLCNAGVFDSFFDLISQYQYDIRAQRLRLSTYQFKLYQKFIKYFIMGWMRPDLLPENTTVFRQLKAEWDEFFLSVSYSKSEVGNYKVKAGLFKSYHYAERYYQSSLEEIKNKLKST